MHHPIALATLALALVCGCDAEPPASCDQPGIGSGPCCTLVLPDGRQLAGVCTHGRCRHTDQPAFDGPCDRDEPAPDATPADVDPDGPIGQDGAPDAQRPADAEAEAGRDGAADVLEDAAARTCQSVVCEPDERCDPETLGCVSVRAGIPGGACESDEDCAVGRCLSEAASDGAVPGGYCSVPCIDAADCAGGHCLEAEDGRLCFESCDVSGRCRSGWTCAGSAGGRRCQVDCRAVGCPGQGRCDAETGACSAPDSPCRYPCAVGESCEQARCVRIDGTCSTDYHCAAGEQCLDARCTGAEFAPCEADVECGPGRRCVPLDDGGICLTRCGGDEQCPLDRACRPDLGACYFSVCGADTGNGELLGPCDFAVDRARPGTCLPFPTPGDAPGYCVEAGLAGPVEPCDAQVEGRSVAEQALRCQPGAICHGDPDDPLHPERSWARRGRCAPLCVPGAACGAGVCVDFGSADDPETEADETVVLGVCLDVECRVLGPPDCAVAERCRPFGLADDAGRCGAAGPAVAGDACASADDCADPALCVSRGAGTECLPLCDPAEPDPCSGGRCYAEDGWGFGVCL